MLRAAMAAAVALIPLATTAVPAQAAETLPLGAAVNSLPLAEENRAGYQRTSFRHWNQGANPTDGCHTRSEVLIMEAVDAPTVGPGCTLTGGRWISYYDAQTVTSASALDIDHMVPLAEAWDSGASRWTAQRREAYANDLGSPQSLVAVTARSNRSKSDQDPSQWLPPNRDALCRYASEWTTTKLRWRLAADAQERDRLLDIAADCPGTLITYEVAP
ncbi:HNH endonuclease family protein [Streptomyces sp. NPDC056244]|uniref:HNH endonuclease family protein n=1 Tax=Streptomyces sp. NPDC056244 TaxID=3345762 RepID=UPI0035DA1DD2